jgi:hypothetical protein
MMQRQLEQFLQAGRAWQLLQECFLQAAPSFLQAMMMWWACQQTAAWARLTRPLKLLMEMLRRAFVQQGWALQQQQRDPDGRSGSSRVSQQLSKRWAMQ